MKKSLVALAVLAASGAAMAQSSVTLFGIVDAGYAVGNGSISDKTSMRNSGYNSSRLGFRGVEDLGGGMKAGFHLEGALSNDDGTPAGFNFQRRLYQTDRKQSQTRTGECSHDPRSIHPSCQTM